MNALRCAVVMVLAGLSVVSSEVRAQGLRPDRLSLSLGVTEIPQGNPSQRRYAFYPELEAFYSLGTQKEAGVSLGGAFYAAGWSDGIRSVSGCADCIIYSYTGGVVGARAVAVLDRLPAPVHFWTGVSEHVLWARYIGGEGFDGRPGSDHELSYAAAEAGTGLYVPFSKKFSVRMSGHIHLPLSDRRSTVYQPKFATGIGIGYSL